MFLPQLCTLACLVPQFVDHHRATGADITIGCLPCDQTRASDFGLMKVGGAGCVMCEGGGAGSSRGGFAARTRSLGEGLLASATVPEGCAVSLSPS